jgi:myo-inositol-1(or 4)-monophosphatase
MSRGTTSTRRADLELARSAALLAGEIALRSFGLEHAVTLKGPDQPLTQTDLVIDRMLRELLTAARPDYGWLSEESSDAADRLSRRRVWIVDPIDGTRSYIAAKPEFTVSIGLAEEGDSVLGVVYNPVRRELFTAARGEGAWLERGATRAPLRVSEARRRHLLVSSGDLDAGRLDLLHGEGWHLERMGSTAYKLALVAAGAATAFATPSFRSEWDVCAGDVIVAEAGGCVTDLAGRELRFNARDPEIRGVIASAYPAQAELRSALGDGGENGRHRRHS